MIFAIASDHAAAQLKEFLLHFLEEKGYTVQDFSPSTAPATHYAEAADRVCQAMQKDINLRGILLCGTGQGSAIRANRYKGIRAALVSSEYTAEMSRAHNDANILVLGERLTTPTLAARFLEIFITTPFEKGRHTPRVAALDAAINQEKGTDEA